MNIVVKTNSGKIVVRPDTTWERDSEDVFLPEFVSRVSWTPVLFARICKPGRSVAKEFAARYYDGINYGILLYPEDLFDGSEDGLACASCLDHSSFLSTPLYDKLTLDRSSNKFIVKKSDEVIYSFNKGTSEMIESAIEQATRYCYIRTGDLLAIELEGRRPLCRREDGETGISGFFCDNCITNFKIIF
ncbi:MAG: hypothetical protein MJY42_04295 [Bacteroidales bacterium]|nr:hypothetical protein [Bacteroidales bacterium]